jgi:hypothetical protein
MAEFKSVAVIKAIECKDELLLYSKANYKVLHRMVSFGAKTRDLGVGAQATRTNFVFRLGQSTVKQ